MIWNLITIGGGAAGFFGAITHAEMGGGSTLILERTSQVLGKVKISGGGRCNVTHDCQEPKAFSAHYPRGEKALIGPLHRWGATETIAWFEAHGVALKTEADGRMFPVTNDSQTIMDCLQDAADDAQVEVRRRCEVTAIRLDSGVFTFVLSDGEVLRARNVLLATGGTRAVSGAKLAESLGHALVPPVPSLFTFKVPDPRLKDLAGVSVDRVDCAIEGTRLKASGPLLVTHWGMSGPGILRLSAWGARELAEKDYQFTMQVDWLPEKGAEAVLRRCRETWGKRQLPVRTPFTEVPIRLWVRLLERDGVSEGQLWSQLTRDQLKALVEQLHQATFEVRGKSMNKDEFVTCGGVDVREIDLKTMESRRCPGLFFAGEIMNVDGITGGFNFQNAWTSGYHAGMTMAHRKTQF
ncbi:MAG: aminoacetone oxidase family FAD-binding enzyme [Verrucomicrobiaceae bacterium]|nr:aminoacetone oxidase family FAD-binding enzyme [Verrucomicrobiaceae bacterium]